MGLFIIWIASIAIATAVGSRRGSPLAGFLLGVFLGPIGALASLALNNSRRPCPYCMERISRDAVKCPHCQSAIEAQNA